MSPMHVLQYPMLLTSVDVYLESVESLWTNVLYHSAALITLLLTQKKNLLRSVSANYTFRTS